MGHSPNNNTIRSYWSPGDSSLITQKFKIQNNGVSTDIETVLSLGGLLLNSIPHMAFFVLITK